jgi:hypothetical protein
MRTKCYRLIHIGSAVWYILYRCYIITHPVFSLWLHTLGSLKGQQYYIFGLWFSLCEWNPYGPRWRTLLFRVRFYLREDIREKTWISDVSGLMLYQHVSETLGDISHITRQWDNADAAYSVPQTPLIQIRWRWNKRWIFKLNVTFKGTLFKRKWLCWTDEPIDC